MVKRMFTFMLAISLLVSCAVSSSAAESQAAETVQETAESAPEEELAAAESVQEEEQEPQETAESAPEEEPPTVGNAQEEELLSSYSEAETNPLYGGSGQAVSLYMSDSESAIPTITGPRLESYGDGVAYLRNAYVNRQTHIEFGFYTEEILGDNISSQIQADAMAHTGNAAEGDYLLFQYYQYKSDVYLLASGNRYCYLMIIDMVYMTDADQEAELDQEIESVLNGLELTGLDTYEKIYRIYNWICSNVGYDYSHEGSTSYLLQYSAYGALINRTAVCQGYSVLLYRMMLESGIDARIIAGRGGGSSHAWNIVQLNGVYYNVDATWDRGGEPYSYFLCCDAGFSGHVRENRFLTESFLQSYPMAESNYISQTEPEPEGLVLDGAGVWYYYIAGEIAVDFTGLVYYYGSWYYVEGGMLNWGYTGLVYCGGSWYYVEKGVLNWGYTGLTYYYGVWYYVEGGVLNWEYTGLVYYGGSWYYVEKGVLNWGYTGLTYYYGVWYYVKGGVLNWGYTGLVYHYGSWYYVEGGVLNWGYTGLTYYYGVWYYVKGGVLNWGYTGLTYYYGVWYYVEGGVLNWGYTGLTYYYGVWYYVEKGVLNWNYTGPASCSGKYYYVDNGAVNWHYTGGYEYQGATYQVVNGCFTDLKPLA